MKENNNINKHRIKNIKAKFTANIDTAPESGCWAIFSEVPDANGQGETIEEAKNNLREAIELILEDRRQDIFRGFPNYVIKEKLVIG